MSDIANLSPPERDEHFLRRSFEVARRALTQLAKIPFKFNITVKGPFRALIGTMRSLHDPTLLIQTTLPDLIRGQPPAPPPVQPKESEIVR